MQPLASLDALKDRRRALAYEVGQGRAALEGELDEVEDEIAKLERGGERATLAEQEARMRAEAEAQGRSAAERAAQEAKLRDLARERLTAAQEVEAQTEGLMASVVTLLGIGAEIYTLSGALRGRYNEKVRLHTVTEQFLSWKLGLGDRPAHAFRKPLTELLPPLP